MVSSTHEHHEFARRRKWTPPIESNIVKGDWEAKGFSFEEVHTPPGSKFQRSKASKDMLLAVAEGELLAFVGSDSPIHLQPGDELFVPEDTELNAENASKSSEAVFYMGQM